MDGGTEVDRAADAISRIVQSPARRQRRGSPRALSAPSALVERGERGPLAAQTRAQSVQWRRGRVPRGADDQGDWDLGDGHHVLGTAWEYFGEDALDDDGGGGGMAAAAAGFEGEEDDDDDDDDVYFSDNDDDDDGADRNDDDEADNGWWRPRLGGVDVGAGATSDNGITTGRDIDGGDDNDDDDDDDDDYSNQDDPEYIDDDDDDDDEWDDEQQTVGQRAKVALFVRCSTTFVVVERTPTR